MTITNYLLYFYHTLYGHIITLGHINFHFSDSDSSPHRAKKSSSSRKGKEEPERRVVRRASPSPPRRVPSKKRRDSSDPDSSEQEAPAPKRDKKRARKDSSDEDSSETQVFLKFIHKTLIPSPLVENPLTFSPCCMCKSFLTCIF